jgi:hypothetical protein
VRIERLVAEVAVLEGWVAKAYGPGDPVFDLLLEKGEYGLRIVVEVKSTTGTTEEKQLRLALGQVLRYRQVLSLGGNEVAAWIAIENPPRDESWIDLCSSAGVTLVWPGSVSSALRTLR